MRGFVSVKYDIADQVLSQNLDRQTLDLTN